MGVIVQGRGGVVVVIINSLAEEQVNPHMHTYTHTHIAAVFSSYLSAKLKAIEHSILSLLRPCSSHRVWSVVADAALCQVLRELGPTNVLAQSVRPID